MCSAPQRRALFRHLNFQKWSERGVFLYILTSKCASRHNGVHFFDIATAKSGPTPWCFLTFWLRNVLRATTVCNFSSLIWPDGSAPAALASLLFDPPQPHIIGKNTVNRDFPTFSRICIFFLLTLSLLWPSLFYSSLLCDSSHLYFSSVRTVGSLTFKLPSIISYHITSHHIISYHIKSYHIISYHDVMLPKLWWFSFRLQAARFDDTSEFNEFPAWTWPTVSRSTGFAVASFLLDG